MSECRPTGAMGRRGPAPQADVEDFEGPVSGGRPPTKWERLHSTSESCTDSPRRPFPAGLQEK